MIALHIRPRTMGGDTHMSPHLSALELVDDTKLAGQHWSTPINIGLNELASVQKADDEKNELEPLTLNENDETRIKRRNIGH